MTAAAVFGCSFLVVLALGLQQLNVSGGHTAAAIATSLLISFCNLILLKLVPQPTGIAENAAYLLGSPIGIVAAMRLHPFLVRIAARRRRWDTRIS